MTTWRPGQAGPGRIRLVQSGPPRWETTQKMPKNSHSPDHAAATEAQTGQDLPAFNQLVSASQNYLAGLSRYAADFMVPYLISMGYFQNIEKVRLAESSPMDSFFSYLKLLNFNMDIMSRGVFGAMQSINGFSKTALNDFFTALYSTVSQMDGEALSAYAARQARLMDVLANTYPQAIQAIEPEYGFHFERGDHELIAETDRFYLYQISPVAKKTRIRKNGKPILILPPYVLGANILGFLPQEGRSYAHCYANRGIPTYIRILKDIESTEALQVMTGEDDARDTRLFCETIKKRHGRPVTLNGYCQGGFSALCNLLSGELDGLVDAFITCVAPMDGTRSKGLKQFLENLPVRFNDLIYGTKTLPNGNQVADGKLMGWVYKLKSIEQESPIASFYRDLVMFAGQDRKAIQISKTAAALNYWLNNERNDLPLEITQMSFASYNVPITADGTLPVKLFGKKLNLKRLQAMGIPWLICYGEHDDLVEKNTALAPLDHIEAEVTPFPKGHVAMATSWSDPESACALHTRFGEGNYRGPVRFQLDLEKAEAKPRKSKPRRKSAAKKKTIKQKNG